MTVQLSLIQDTTIKKTIINVPIEQLSLSNFNPRTTRPDKDINDLAQRISQNGFEITRALWVYKNGDGYRVFAGGTRLEAARRAACKTVPVVLHDGLTDEEKVRLAYEDNENDEYHAPVSIVDIWANYAALAEQGWTQQRIADAVGVKQSMVSYRLNLHMVSDQIKGFISQGKLKEEHLRQITQLSVDLYFSPWLTTTQAYLELCQLAAKGLTVRQTKELVSKWKGFIELAHAKYEYLKDQQGKYETTNKIELNQRYHNRFIQQLAKIEARTKSAVSQAYAICRDNYLAAVKEHEDELRRQQGEAEAERLRIEKEKAKTAEIESVLSNIHHGDFYEICKQLEDDSIDVILTDPPYPEEYIPEYGRLSEVAARVLKPGGFLLAMSGQLYLPRILPLMTSRLNYHWLISYNTPGGQSPQIWPKKINTFWKPVLWFVKGEYQGSMWFGDVVSSDVNNNDKEHHKWGQSESGFGCLVEKYTKPDDVILDPFFGGGTLGIVAIKTGRKFIGIEKEKDVYENSKERIFSVLEAK